MIARVTRVRRDNPALQRLDNLTFLETENDALIAYLKRAGDNAIVCVVNLDPHAAQEGLAVVPPASGLPPAFRVTDLLDGASHDWRLGRNYVRLEPGQSHVVVVQR